MNETSPPLAVVTGASSGIGYELAKCCAEHGFDLIVCADEPEIKSAANDFAKLGVKAKAVQADLSTLKDVDKLCRAIGDKPVAALLANAGRGLPDAFFEQTFEDALRVLNTNVKGTIYLIHKVGSDMRERGAGAPKSKTAASPSRRCCRDLPKPSSLTAPTFWTPRRRRAKKTIPPTSPRPDSTP